MKRLLVLVCISALLVGCGYKEVQLEYYKTVQKQMELKAQNQHEPQPLLDLQLDESGAVQSIQVADQTRKDQPVQIRQPASHPGYSLVGSLCNSPVAGILAGGFAGKMLLQEAGTHMTNSKNSVGGDGAFSYDGSASIDNGIASSYNQPDNSISDSYNDSSDNSEIADSYNDSSDNSAVDSHDDNSDSHDQNWQDSHDQNWTDDNSDNRYDYGNDNRTDYDKAQAE